MTPNTPKDNSLDEVEKILQELSNVVYQHGKATRTLLNERELEARHDELNLIVKAEDYVYTASNDEHPYTFNVENYAEARHKQLTEEAQHTNEGDGV